MMPCNSIKEGLIRSGERANCIRCSYPTLEVTAEGLNIRNVIETLNFITEALKGDTELRITVKRTITR